MDHVLLILPTVKIVGDFLGTFEDYPPRMKARSFNLDNVMEKLTGSGSH
jgi:arylsulfatase